MTAPFYTRSIATVKRMLGKYGMTVQFSHTDQWGAVTTWQALALKTRTVQKILGETGVQLGDDEFLVEAAQVPGHGDRISYAPNEDRVVVQPVDTFEPAGDLVYFTVYARKG